MKLRGQLNLLLLATALVPFIATSLFSYQLNRVAKEESSNHLESMIVAKSISRTLNQNAQMFDGSAKELGRLALKQHENVQLGLYSKDRALQFQSASEEGVFATHLTPEGMFSNLYSWQSSDSAYIYKEPIFLQDQIAGYFELRFDKSGIRKETKEVYMLTILFFLITVGITLFIVQHWFKRNMLVPFAWMKAEMDEVAYGKQNRTTPVKRGRTEVGQLMDNFANMAAHLRAIDAQKQSDDEDRKKLIAAISHDLRTPLTSIRAYAEGMHAHPDKREEYSKVILAKTEYMQRLIEDLLIFSQVHSTSFSLSLKKVDAEELVELLFDGYDLEKEQLRLSTSMEIEPAEVDADAGRLVQVMDNLVTNAICYSPEGGAISLYATNKQSCLPPFVARTNEQRLYIFVKDEGQGIPSGVQRQLFDPFFQVEQARSQTNDKGVGLGLSICRELIHQHGGTIDVYSSPPHGSTFFFSIPCIKTEGGNE